MQMQNDYERNCPTNSENKSGAMAVDEGHDTHNLPIRALGRDLAIERVQ